MAQEIPRTSRTGLAAVALAAALASGAEPPNLAGRWNAEIQGLQGIYLLLERGPQGDYAGMFSFPYETRRPMAVTGVEISGARVVLEFQSAGARWEGVINEEGAEMIGLFTGRSGDVPMRFIRWTPQTDPLTIWLKRNAIPVKTALAGNGFADLLPLKSVVGDARLVALGEATPGTREFLLWKHRLIEFLISELGFTALAVEGGYSETLAVNEYVITGRGDPRKALAGLRSWAFNTEEMLGLVEWLRQWNASPAHPRKVRLYGLDMLYPQEAARRVLAAIAARAPGETSRARILLEPLTLNGAEDSFLGKPRQDMQALATALAGLAPLLEDDAEARQHLRILEQCTGRYTGGPVLAARDKAMADKAAWILEREGPQGRLIVWAHNSNIAADPGPGLFPPMGSLLRRRLGTGLVAMGFSFDQGGFRASEPGAALREFHVGPAVEGSLDRTLAAAGLPLLALDLRRASRTEPAASWLAQPMRMRSVGGLYSPSMESSAYFTRFVARDFDVVLFVARTTASRGLPD